MGQSDGLLITGDYIIDHHLLKGNKSQASGQESIGTMILSNYGGAKLTFELIGKFVNKILSDPKHNRGIGPEVCDWHFTEMPALGTTQGTKRDSYLRWIITEKEKKGNKELICTLDEMLGFGVKQIDINDNWLIPDPKLSIKEFNTIVIDEAGVGYRDCEKAWPNFEKADKIVLKTTYPLCEGLLWDTLLKHKQKLITIVNLNQIKQYEIKVSNDISWEQTALDIVYGIHKDLTLKNLLKSSELIVTIGTAGAIIIKTGDNIETFEYSLVFDPEYMEDEWEERHSKDIQNKIGLGSSFLAGFVSSLRVKDLGTIDSVKVGLNAMTGAMVNGVFQLTPKHSFEPMDLSDAIDKLFFDRYYSSAFIPSPAWEPGFKYLHNQDWSILENNYDNLKKGYKQKSDFFPLAFSLAENGINSLHYAPRMSLGKVTIFDRNEIENMKNIRKQVDFYDRYEDGKKPLNIAVFGPPGAGKSFIVKALANSMFEGKKTKPSFLTFNLSQFKDESELSGAFHAIRDEVLKGKLPVVFWDEFDSTDYKWLKSLLAPMQDGEFQEGKEVHPIGKSIFVFAGGMTYTMSQFADKMEGENYIIKKGPDFQSRINCYLNVFGPNRKPFFDSETGKWIKEGDNKDICFSIRRALFIRSILGSGDKHLNIDQQLLRVLIEVSNYKNGSRGLERLLKNLAIHNDRKIERSDLPSKEIIQMNVDYEDFMKKLSDESTSGNMAFEKIAVTIHNAWLEKDVTQSVYYKKYEDLSFDHRMDNISAAMRMYDVVKSSGKYSLISEPELKSKLLPDAKDSFSEFLAIGDNLDKMAEMEHKGWMEARKLANWQPGVRSDYHKRHHCLVPFSDLDKGIEDRAQQKEKNKDRDTITKYTTMLVGSGYTITSNEPV
jgi:hypothetical protein